MTNPFDRPGDWNDPDQLRHFYDSIPPAKLAECEQFYADAQRDMNEFIEGVLRDIESREALIGIHDDSIQFAITHTMLTQLAFLSGPQAIGMWLKVLVAAAFKLARAPRATRNPLAHLEDDTTEGDTGK